MRQGIELGMGDGVGSSIKDGICDEMDCWMEDGNEYAMI